MQPTKKKIKLVTNLSSPLNDGQANPPLLALSRAQTEPTRVDMWPLGSSQSMCPSILDNFGDFDLLYGQLCQVI